MQYTLATVLALATAATAQIAGFDPITSPPEGTTMKAGEPFVIEWQAAPSELDDAKIDILLLAGKTPSTLSVVDTPIAEGLTNSAGSFEWLVPADLGDDETYGIKIALSSNATHFQFSFPFAIDASEDGGKGGNSTATAKPTKTSSDDETETEVPTGSDDIEYPETTMYTTTPPPTVPSSTTSITGVASPGAGAQATAGAMALFGGLAIAALGM